jgi:hypothetical protein
MIRRGSRFHSGLLKHLGPGDKQRKNDYSLIGSRPRKYFTHPVKDGLKEGECQVHPGLTSLLDASMEVHAGRSPCPAISGGVQTGNRGKIRRSEPKFGREEWFMKTRIIGLLALASLILAFAFIATAPAAPNKAGVPATAAGSALPATPAAERHPEIREALEALRRAKEHMEHAAHDFGGHRVEAIEATDRAIKQLELCLKFDKD